MKDDVDEVVSSCHDCARDRARQHQDQARVPRPALETFRADSDRPGKSLSIHLPWKQVHPSHPRLLDQESPTVPFSEQGAYFHRSQSPLRSLLDVGAPRNIQSDQGNEFSGPIMNAVCVALEISRSVSSAYHPMCQVSVERFSGMKAYLSRMLKSEDEDKWDMVLKL